MLDQDITTARALHNLSRPEMAFPDAHALDRRRFLQLVGMGLGAGAVAGPGTSILDSVLAGGQNTAWAAGPIADDDGILIVIGMFGGNDGLNTVVPINDGLYYQQRNGLSIPAAQALPINGNTGLHPALTALKDFWDLDQLAIVEGVGYPNPDLSHFNSMAKWMAGKPTGIPSSGWVGRWLDGYLNGSKDLYAAAEVGYSLPLHMIGEAARATTVPASRPSFGAGTSERDLRQYQTIRNMNTAGLGHWEKEISQAFVDQLDIAKTIAPEIPAELPDVDIVARLEVAARLINANLGFRVLTAGWGDFDSHSGQNGQHPVRMQELNEGIRRFFEVLHPSWGTRVTIMTFSEFGRTSHSDGDGTDHGTSAPHFVFGANVKGGLYGQRPTLAGLERWERMAHHVDFRDYYGSVIDGWLGGGGSDVLGKPIENLGLFAEPPGTVGGFPPELLGDYVALTPKRILDTRSNIGGRSTKVGPGKTLTFKIAGAGGVPSSGVGAVALNITAVGATEGSFLTVFPGDIPKPESSNLNTTAQRAVANMVTVGLSPAGEIKVFNARGSTHCIIDVMGYYSPTSAGRLNPLNPARVLDTRKGIGASKAAVGAGKTVELKVTGRGGVPASGVDAVVFNLTAVRPAGVGFVTAFPTGGAVPNVSNVNYQQGMNVPNLVVCKVGDGGKVSLAVSVASVELLADVVGYYSSTGNRHVPVPPKRLLDTRFGVGAAKARVGPKSEVNLRIANRGVPATATAVLLNVTAVRPSAHTFVTVYPDGTSRPETSNLNMVPQQTVPNLVVAKIGSTGNVRLYNEAGDVDLIADVTGFFL